MWPVIAVWWAVLLPGNWKPVSDSDGGGGARMFIQTSSRMNDLQDDEDPF